MSEQPQTREYFFLLTVKTADGYEVARGTCTLAPGKSRQDVFEHLIGMYFPQAGASAVVAFDLQPNQL